MKKITPKKTIFLLFLCFSSISIYAQLPFIQWQKSLGGGMYDYSKEIDHTSDGGFITIGYTESNNGDVSFNRGAGDWWIVKTNAAGTIEWGKTYGGTGFDYGYSIQQTSDGGYIAAGYTESNDGDVISNNGGGDSWIIKLDAFGAIEWQKTFGGSLTDNAQCVRQTADDGYIICGYSESSDGDVTGNHGGGDCWIIKLNELGSLEWQTALGGSSYDFAQDIKQTPDGGYVMSGGSNSNDGDVTGQNGNGDCWIAKLDLTGTIIWENSLGGSNYDFGQSIEMTDDGGYIIAGYSESNDVDVSGQHGNGDCWIIKCNNSGNLQWQKSLGSTGNDYAFCIQQLTAGGYLLTGYSEMNDGDVSGNHGNYDCWIVKLDELGTIQMQKSIGGTGVDIGYSIRETSAQTYIIAGYSESTDGDVFGNHGGGDSWIIKLGESSVGMNETIVEQTVSVAPNVSSGYFNFYGLAEESKIEIYDVTGKIIFETNVKDEVYNMDISNQAKGIYFYRIRLKNEAISSGKIMLN